MTFQIREIDRNIDKCEDCGADLYPKNWNHSPFDYQIKKWCDHCKIFFVINLPKKYGDKALIDSRADFVAET